MNGSRSWNYFCKAILFFHFFFPHRNDTGVFVSDVVSCNVHWFCFTLPSELPACRFIGMSSWQKTFEIKQIYSPKLDETAENRRNWPKLGETDRNRRNWPKLDKTIRKQTEAFVIRRVYWLVSFMNIGSCKMHSSKENDMSCFFDRILLHIPSLIGNYNEKNDKTMINLCFSDISDEPDQLLQPLTLVFLPSLIKCSFINWFQLWLTGERWYRRGRRSSSSWWPDPLGQRWGS